ncbi:T9SS type A sorting domain-containing protein [Candidatus Poribacteria bacterium]|nr:T9SS type A sorting domain-containing protein [Candidatus Poribacteria bacterium]
MFLPGHDDGVVSVDSASLEGKGVPLYCVELDHSSIVNPYRVLDRKSEEQLSRAELLLDMYSDIIRPILEGCPPSPSSVSCNCPTGEDPDDNQQLPYRLNLFTLRLRQGDSTEGIFDAPSEGVRIEFGFTIPFGDFDFTLTSPTGREITPDVANQDPDIDYVTLDNYWYYSIKNPEPGGWQYHITAVEVPEEGVDVTIIAVAEVSGVPNVLGDVSQDGRVKANDALLVLQHAVGLITLLPEQQQAADVNGDDKITAFDAALIMQYTVGLITEFPVQGVPILVAKDDNPLAPFIPLNKGGQGGCKGDENQLLAKIIAELENSSLSAEQKRVLEELKHLLWQRTLPKQTALLQNYPNPFNPETWIPFELAQDASVTISIYNVKGQLIRTIELGNQKAGIYVAEDKAAYWNGKDSLGEKVASGMYFYTLQAGKFRTTRKMVIMK